MDRAGITTCRQAAVLIHLGRCGLAGTTIPAMIDALRMGASTLCCIINHLTTHGLVVDYTRRGSKGRARLYIVTVKGWEVLTSPADFSAFPNALALKIK